MTQPVTDGRYDTVADFLDAANNELRNPRNREVRDLFLHTQYRGGWYGAGCGNGDDVQKLLRDGWTEGRQRVDAFMAKLGDVEAMPLDIRRRITRCDFGDHLDIGDVYAGRMATAWTRARRKSAQGPKHVDLLANMICAAGDSAEVLFWRGAAAVALCDKLEAAGYMVRLVVGFGGPHPGGEEVSCRVTIKDHGLPMDIATASAVIMPGFFRAVGHGWIAGHAKYKDPKRGIHVRSCVREEGEIYLSHEVTDERTARRWVEGQIETVNKPAEAA